ncbi:hypothetical protein D3C72_1931510 [compost metagenome]
MAERRDFFGITGDGINESIAYRHQFVAALLDLFFQIRLVLEGVDVEIAIIQRFVGQHVIIEGHHFHIQIVFLFGDFLYGCPHGLIDAGADADFYVVVILFGRSTGSQQQAACYRQRRGEFFQRKCHFPESLSK